MKLRRPCLSPWLGERARASLHRILAEQLLDALGAAADVSRRISYSANRSERLSEPVWIRPQFVATAMSAIVVSSVSPEWGLGTAV